MRATLKQKQVFIIDYRDLLQMAESMYGIKAEIDAVNNYTDYLVTDIYFQMEPEKRTDTLQRVLDMRVNGYLSIGSCGFQFVIQDLVNMGWLPFGNYVVEVFW